jgi:hypothetical protein
MTISSAYARFECRICGETVYSPILAEQPNGDSGGDGALELTCSGGHTDQYRWEDVVLVPKRPEGSLRVRYARAAGG